MQTVLFYINSILLGVGLAMDAFSVCVANGLNESEMDKRRKCHIAGVFAAFQFIMPMIGWICVKTVSSMLLELQKYIPWIAFGLLAFIGIKMIFESSKEVACISHRQLFVQGVATSIDALSVGFAISDYTVAGAIMSSVIIGIVTYIICIVGLGFGNKVGGHFANKATIFGGIILICIGFEILLTGHREVSTMIKTEEVKIQASVRSKGQYPESFTVRYSKDIDGRDLSSQSFHMKGKAGSWGSSATHDFEADFTSLSVNGDTLTLVPGDFPEKFFYVTSYDVVCDDPELSFSDRDVTDISTLVADDFETLKASGDKVSFDYHLYTPGEKKNMPLVVVFHGYGDTNNLLTYKTAVAWAEPENQQVRPCYVMAPVIPDDMYFDAGMRKNVEEEVMNLVNDMIGDGRVDPDRVYLMGNSFGGMTSIETAEMYPDKIAGVMALCPALMYSKTAMADITKMKDVPVWILHAEHDGTIPFKDSTKAVEILKKAGASNARITGFGDEEMNAAGADPDKDSTYSYHHVELLVMEEISYMEWLYGLT